MKQETKKIHLSDQQRREAVTRLMSRVIISEHRAPKIKKVRRNVIQQMCVAFTKAVHAESQSLVILSQPSKVFCYLAKN